MDKYSTFEYGMELELVAHFLGIAEHDNSNVAPPVVPSQVSNSPARKGYPAISQEETLKLVNAK